jgi:uncharacterized protein (TIGR03084 family)
VEGPLANDLLTEQLVLDAHLASLDEAGWARPTPAEGWTVADTVRHLLLADLAAARSADEGVDFTAGGIDDLPTAPEALFAAWRDGRAAVHAALAARPDGDRVPWGGRAMSVRSLATARLMETWAHGLDCLAAAGVPAIDTDRLVHIAWLGRQTLPYAFGFAGVEPPAPPLDLRVELVAPSGAHWRFGPDDSPHVVTGPAGTWCRVVTHRLRPPAVNDLVATDGLAAAAVQVAKAYLA